MSVDHNTSASPRTSYNLANHPTAYRQAIESHKAETFAFWQQNLQRSYAEAGRIFGEKKKRKTAFTSWAESELKALEPAQFQGMVRAELSRLISGKPRAE